MTRDEQIQVWNEINLYKAKFKPGLFVEGGSEKVSKTKKNQGVMINSIHTDIFDSKIRSIFYDKILFNKEFMDRLPDLKNPLFEALKFTNNDTTKISAYGNGDYYDWHRDIFSNGILTMILTLSSLPTEFSGGEIVLKHDGKEKQIPFENNTLIIFPRSTLHKVNAVKLEPDYFENRRFSIQCFTNMKF